MFRNHLKTAWRSIFKNRTFSFINIMGLALGMACSLLIMLWVHDERSVDAFHQNDEQLYRVYTRHFHDGVIDGGHYGPGLLASELKVVYPEVKFATMMAWNELNTFEGNNKVMKKNGDYGSPDFFSVFSYPLVEGMPETALKDPVDIAISRKMAEDFFGSAHAAMGQTLRFQNNKDLKVSAVFENINSLSSKTFEYLVNWETFLENNQWARDWGNNGPQTTIVLQPGTDVAAFENKAKDFLDAHNDNKNYVVKLALQKHSESYLHSEIKGGEIVGGRIQYVVLFTITSVLILLIACVNFMNLTTARSIRRAKEIGVRKVVGAVRSALVRQFIGEALLIVVLAVALSLIIVALALPAFNSLTQKQIALPITEPVFWGAIIGLTAITGLLSGSYPALYLSAFNPVRAFKGALKFSSGALWFRKGLVVFQFTLSLMLIIGTIVISRQVGYIQSAHLGYDRENLIYIPLEGELIAKYHTFKQQALAQSGIKMISRISQSPTSISNGTGGVKWDGKDPNSMVQFSHAAIGLEFTRTMNIQLVDGRDFGIEFPSDSSAYLLNEAAVKLIGFKDPVGMSLTFWDRPGKVVGVIKDFHFQSLHTNIEPLVLRLGEDLEWGWALVRVEPGKTKKSLASLEKICKELNPQFPFTYEFSDEEYQKLYKSEQTVEVLSNIFAGLAIFISCLGLLGLSMFTAEQRTKEIGIRKVLGAGVFSLFNLLSRDLFLLVAVSLLIASPIAWYFMNDWLKAFAYKVNVGWWIFVVAGCLAILIALATVSVHTLKAIFTNPVKSLRSE